MQRNKIQLITGTMVMLTIMPGFGQVLNTELVDPVRNRPVLVDYISREGLDWGEFAAYNSREYSIYQPEPQVVSALKEHINGFDVLIVMATWCIDSKEQVPRFLKVLDAAGYSPEKLLIVGVDSEKKAREVETEFLNIQRVPTFIVYKEGIEAGRIIETPVNSLELDLLNIIR